MSNGPRYFFSESICSEDSNYAQSGPPDGNIGANGKLYFQTGSNISSLREGPKTRDLAEADGW